MTSRSYGRVEIGPEIIGLTNIGRATVRLLGMNEDERVVVRVELQAEGLL